MSKNAYELRLELLVLAKQFLSEKYSNESYLADTLRCDNKPYTLPVQYTSKDILNLAEEFSKYIVKEPAARNISKGYSKP